MRTLLFCLILLLLSCSSSEKEIIGTWSNYNHFTTNSSKIFKFNKTYLRILNDSVPVTYKYILHKGISNENDTIYLSFHKKSDIWTPEFLILKLNDEELILNPLIGGKVTSDTIVFNRISFKVEKIDPKEDMKYHLKGIFDIKDTLLIDSLYNSW
ncbi:MAG TPA: hypothetical protein VKZ45_08790 [Vicingaceae bacterium]|nr:hypothetical protein [Vicingaceae bacterium]